MLAGNAGSAVISAAPAVRPIVLELYTSQGCSSCPPAEALLGELATREGVLALAYHVDYWDELGWRDRFSLASATERQRHWAQLHVAQTIYTPQLIVDGRQSLVGSDATAVSALLQAAPALSLQHPALPFTATVSDGQLRVDAPASAVRDSFEIYAISFLPQATTRIEHGENAGRTIQQTNIVRSITRLGSIAATGAHLRVPISTFPADAVRVAVLLQDTTSAGIHGAQVLELR
jgi:hypothetical protein